MTQTAEIPTEELTPSQESYLSQGRFDRARGFHRLWYVPPITANELLGETMDENRGYFELYGLKLAAKPIHYFALQWLGTPRIEVIGFINTRLHGGDVNKILFSNAPNKGYALDTQDLLTDWREIDNLPTLKLIHFNSLGLAWEISESNRVLVAEEIEKWHKLETNLRPDDPEPDIETLFPGFVPVIRFDNKGHWIFDPLNAYPYVQLREGISEEFFPGNPDQAKSQWFDPVIGLWVVGHLSPDITRPWEQKYHHVTLTPEGHPRENTPSRAGAFTIRQGFELFGSEFMRASRNYIYENAVPVMLK